MPTSDDYESENANLRAIIAATDDRLSAAETSRAAAEARATQAEAELDRLRRDFPPAPPLAIAGCDCAACVRLRAMWAEPDVRTVPSVREAARRRMPLDGTDAQALEGAVTITEAERDEARAERARLREALRTAEHARDSWYVRATAADSAVTAARKVVRLAGRDQECAYSDRADLVRARERAVDGLALALDAVDCAALVPARRRASRE
jgi:hypothetical protein